MPMQPEQIEPLTVAAALCLVSSGVPRRIRDIILLNGSSDLHSAQHEPQVWVAAQPHWVSLLPYTVTLKLSLWMGEREITIDAMTDASTVITPLASFQDDRLALVDRLWTLRSSSTGARPSNQPWSV
jgi:hypothetical protein